MLMSKGRERYIFPGGNTPWGFYSFYNQMMNWDIAWQIYIIKGGPGTGKSGIIKKIAKAAANEGYDTELMRCSGDINSLDGVIIPALKVSVIDGTSPHVVDAALPGVRDHIISLGDYWDQEGIQKNKSKIQQLKNEISHHYRKAYNYLAAARTIRNNMDMAAESALYAGKLNIFTGSIIETFFNDLDISPSEGGERKMFATAITAKGIYGDLASIFDGCKVYALKCDYGDAASQVLDLIKKAAIIRGFRVEGYYCPFSPDKIQHLVIPKLNTAFTTFNKYHAATDSNVIYEYPLNEYYNDLVLEKYKKDMEYDEYRVDELIERAVRTLSKAYSAHREMEECYTPYMDFEAIDHFTSALIEDILSRQPSKY